MNRLKESLARIVEQILPWFVLAILLLYTYARLFEHPYVGFRWDDHNQIILIFVQGNPITPLQIGDRLIQAGPIRLADFEADYGQRLFNGVQAGQIVPIIIERANQQITIPWRFPGLNRAEFLDQAISEVWLAFIFWLAGTLTLLFLRPKNVPWRLMIAFNYLTAGWIAVGGGASFYHLWYSDFLLRIFIWLCVPLYLHFHWYFPVPLGKLPAWLVRAGYLLATVLSILECFHLLPANFYLLGFLLAVGGSFFLLIAHLILQAEARRDLGFLIAGIALALIFSITVGVVLTATIFPEVAAVGLAGLPFIPLAYFYAAFRRQLGDMELRVNRFISIYLFLVLLGLVMLLLIVLANLWIMPAGGTIIIGLAASLVTGLIAVFGFPPFESFVDHRLLGLPHLPKNLQEIYSTRSTTRTTLSQLGQLLRDEIMPSLLVREFAFLQFEAGTWKTLLEMNLPGEGPLHLDDIPQILSFAGKYRPPALLGKSAPFPWVRLILRLEIEHNVIGLWLFGRRDPDDLYSQSEIDVFQSLANQAGVALENTRLHEETLRQLQRLQALHAIDQAIAGSLEERFTLDVLLTHALGQLNADAATVFLLQPHQRILQFVSGKGFRTHTIESASLKLGETFAGQAVLNRKMIEVKSPDEMRPQPHLANLWSEEGFRSSHIIPLISRGEVKGVLSVYHRRIFTPDQAWISFFETVAGQAAIAIDNVQMFNGLKRANMELAVAYDATIEGWSQAMDLRDKETEGHTERVTEMSIRLGRAMKLGDEELVHMRRGALLHDIGKLGVPDHILLKPDKLTDEEMESMKKHPQFAYDMLSSIKYLRRALDIPHCHHEKWDGTGYPQGLKGQEIPLPARIFAIVDVWDALTSDRPYRRAWTKSETLNYIREQSRRHFDPEVVAAFEREFGNA